jgi:hypothetical protein
LILPDFIETDHIVQKKNWSTVFNFLQYPTF